MPDAPAAPTDLSGVTIGHVGHFDPAYPRNRTMAKALRRAGATVVPIPDQRGWSHRMPGLVAEITRHRADVLLVGFPAQTDVGAVRIAAAARRVPVIADVLVSIYETAEDRSGTVPTGWKRRRYELEDRWSARLAHLVLLDTEAHIAYFVERFGVPKRKFRRVWLGTDDEVMYPRPRQGADCFRACFYGAFTPLQGIEHILDAARLLEDAGEDVKIELLGDGGLSRSLRQRAVDIRLQSVRFLPRQPYEQLPEFVASSDLWLGNFSTSPKASRIIPNKVFDGLAMARPILTGNTSAAREALEHGTSAWLVPPGDPSALAEGIIRLKRDAALRESIAAEGHRLFKRCFSLDALSAEMTSIVNGLLAH